MHCVNCGRQYDPSHRFCNNCGVELPYSSYTAVAESSSDGRFVIKGGPREQRTIEMQFPITMRDAERALIIATLKANDDNKTHAAKILGISLKTLHNKLREYRLQRD